MYLSVVWVFVADRGLSLVAATGGGSLVAVVGLLTAVISLVAKHRLCGSWASVLVAHELSCSAACRVFPDQELNGVSCTGRWIVNHWATREAPEEGN